jgi:hypothetical protein
MREISVAAVGADGYRRTEQDYDNSSNHGHFDSYVSTKFEAMQVLVMK